MASPPFFTKVLKWSDFKVGIISAVVTGISAASMAFAATTLQLALCKSYFKIQIMNLYTAYYDLSHH